MTHDRRLMLAIFALAFGMRVLYPVLFGEQTALASGETSEFVYAKAIASGFDWLSNPVSPMSPGYPVFLAALYLIGAKQLWIVILLQAALGALTVVLVYRMAVQLLGLSAGVLATLWYALSINHIRAVGELQSDILSAFLLALLMWLLARPFQRMLFGIVTGIVYGVLIHVEPVYLLLLPMFAALVLWKTRHPILNLQYLFLFAATIILFCAPWTLRNNAVYGQPIPISLEAERFLGPARSAANPAQRSELEAKVATASRTGRIERNVIEFWRFARFKDSSYVSPANGEIHTVPAWSTRYNVLSILTFGVLLPFFAIGVVLAFRTRHRHAVMFVVVVAYYFLVRSYFNGNVRTRMPAEPFIIMVGFFALIWLRERLRAGRGETATGTTPTPD